MNDPKNAELAAVIEKQIRLAESIRAAIKQAMERDVPLLGRTGNAAVLVSGTRTGSIGCAWEPRHKIDSLLTKLDQAHDHAIANP